MKDERKKEKGISKCEICLGALIVIIVLYFWSISTPGALAMDMPLNPMETSGQPYLASLSPSTGGVDLSMDPTLMSLGYLSAFFAGGIALTMLQGRKNKSQRDNDLPANIKVNIE